MQDLYKGFKKISEDDSAALLEHENGHKLHIAKSGLSKKHLKNLEKLPIHKYDGGTSLEDERLAALNEEMAAVERARASEISTPVERYESPARKLGRTVGEKILSPMVENVMQLGQAGKEYVVKPIVSAGMAINEAAKQAEQASGEFLRGAAGLEGKAEIVPLEQRHPELFPAKQTQVAERAPTYEETQVTAPPVQPQLAGSTQQELELHKQNQQGLVQPPTSREVTTATEKPLSIEQKNEQKVRQLQQEQQPPGMVLSKDEMVMMDPNANPYDRAMATQNVINTRIMARKKADDEFYKEMMKPENDIKLQNYFHDKNAFQQIVGALSLIAGGVSGGLLKTENPAMKLIENAINRELEVQKLSKERKLNLYKMHREAEGDEMNALLQTSNNLKQLVQMKADQMMGLVPGAAGSQGNKLFNMRLQKLWSDMETGIAENRLKQSQYDVQKLQQGIKEEAFRGTATSGAPGQAGLRADNPARLVEPLFGSNEKDKENAYKELRHRLEINEVAPDLLRLFDEIDSPTPTPGAEAAFQGLLTTLVPKIEGGQSQGAMEATKSKYTPNKYWKGPGENKRIRKSLVTWLKSGSADPTWRKYGDKYSLDNFASTAHPWARETVRRIDKQGRTVLFDANTKQFIGYE